MKVSSPVHSLVEQCNVRNVDTSGSEKQGEASLSERNSVVTQHCKHLLVSNT